MTTTERLSATTLRQQISKADDAMRGISVLVTDLQGHIAAARLSREQIESAQATRTTHIHDLQSESGQLAMELEDLKIDTLLQGTEATADSVKWRTERCAEIKTELKEATADDKKLLKEESVQLAQIEAEKVVLEAQLTEQQDQHSVFENKRRGIFEALGEAVYTEGGEYLAEIDEARTSARRANLQYEHEGNQARLQLNRDLKPWESLRQRAVRTFNLDVKPEDSTTKVIRKLLELLDTLEAEGNDVPLMIDSKVTFTQLYPLSEDALRAMLGSSPMAMKGLDRRNWFGQRRVALNELLEKYNGHRW